MLLIWKVSALSLLISAVVTFALAQNVNYTPDPNWKAPPEAAAKPNPLADKPGAVAGGRKLFQRNCVECHGAGGTGEKNNSANFTLPAVQDQSDGTLFWKITNGNPRRGMPSFSGLPELQRWQLVLYIRTFAQRK